GNCNCNMCPYMALNTLDKLYVALRDLQPRIELSAEIMDRARVPLERMLEMAGRTVGHGDVGRPIIEESDGASCLGISIRRSAATDPPPPARNRGLVAHLRLLRRLRLPVRRRIGRDHDRVTDAADVRVGVVVFLADRLLDHLRLYRLRRLRLRLARRGAGGICLVRLRGGRYAHRAGDRQRDQIVGHYGLRGKSRTSPN